MKYTFFLLILVFSTLFLHSAETVRYSSYSGRNFYISFMQNEIESNKDELVLRAFLTAINPTPYEVIIPGYPTIRGELKANDIKEIEIAAALEVKNSEIALSNKAIQITSEMPISVYCFSSKLTTSDSYAAIPVSRWGTEYVVMSYPNDQYDDPERWNLDSLERWLPRSSQFMIMAAYDSTVINFTPRSTTRGGKFPSENYNVRLDKGEVYLVQSDKAPRGLGDLTGTIVRSNKPFGLLSGHVRTAVPQTNRYPFDSKDHLIEMLPPTNTWGKKFISTPFGVNNKGDLFRVAAIKPGTVLTLKKGSNMPVNYPLNNPGGWVEITNVDDVAIWTSNYPIQIVQYMRHTGEYGDSKEYDPAIVVLPPTEQFVQDIVFLTPRNYRVKDQFQQHRVGLVFEQKALNNITLDGNKIIGLYDIDIKPVPNSNYYWTSIMLPEGRHQLRSDSGSFSGILYAFGFHDSYAMSLGNALVDPYNQDTLAPKMKVEERCGFIKGTAYDNSYEYDTGIDFARVYWYRVNNYDWDIKPISDTARYATFTASPIDIHKDGNFEIEFFDKNSNVVRYAYSYKGIRVSHISDLFYQNLSWFGKECKTFKIYNNSIRTVVLDSLKFSKDNRLSLSTSVPLPTNIKAGDSVTVTVCFTPQGDSTSLQSKLTAYFDCDYSSTISINGNVQAPQFVIEGYHFGKVRVGSKKCGTVKLTNTGNTDITIDNLNKSKEYPDFEFESIVYPITLRPGESKLVQVCFTPSVAREFNFQVEASNNFGLSGFADISGEGIAPSINSIVIDWGKKRVGTIADTVAAIANSGNDSTYLFFKGFSAGNSTMPNAIEIASLDGKLFYPGDSQDINFSFAPDTPESYHLVGNFETDWDLHPELKIELTGEGTLPTIKTYNFRFDTTKVSHDIDSVMLAFTTSGNEDLTIDKVVVRSGDVQSFDIRTDSLAGIKIPSGENINMPVSFRPRRAGEHSIIIEVTHDGNPNYQRSIDTIIVSGYALPIDTLSYTASLSSPPLMACNAEDGYFVLSNTGNVDINLQRIEITRVPDNFVASLKPSALASLPLLIKAQSTARLDMDFYAERNKGGNVIFDIYFNDSLQSRLETQVFPIVQKIEIQPHDKIEYTPGDTVRLTLQGKFPHGTDPKIIANMKFSFNRYMLELLTTSSILKLTNATDTLNIDTRIEQNKNILTFKPMVDSLSLTDSTNWEISLAFFGLLHSDDSTGLAFTVSSDNCFDPQNIIIPLKITNVCNFPLRPIKLIANLPYLIVAPNPIVDKIGVELYLVEDDEISLYLTDAMGKVIQIASAEKLTKGRHYLTYDASEFASGVYSISCFSKHLNGKNIFIITK